MTSKNARPPAGLGAAGRRIFRQIQGKYELRADEMLVLENACQVADTIETITAALLGEPLVTAGVGGQDRVHPLLVELRQQRVVLASLLRQLGLPDEDGVAVNQQRSAGNASWTARAGRLGGSA